MVKKNATCYNDLFEKSFLEISMKKFVLLTILFFIIFTGCGTEEKKESVSLSHLINYIPEGATGIFTINYERIKKYGIYKGILSDLKSEIELQSSVVDKMNSEFREDLKYIAITTFEKNGQDNLLILMAGEYDEGKVASLLNKGDNSSYKSANIYSFEGRDQKGKNIEGFIATVDGNKLLMSSSNDLIKRSIDIIRKNERDSGNNKELRKYIKGYSKKRRILSLAWKFPEKYRNFTKDIPFAKINLSKAEVIVAKVNYVNNVWDGIIKLITNDPDTNQKIAATLNGIKFMGAMAGPEVEELLKRITLSASSEAVKIHFSVSDSLLKELKKKAGKRIKMNGLNLKQGS